MLLVTNLYHQVHDKALLVDVRYSLQSFMIKYISKYCLCMICYWLQSFIIKYSTKYC